MKKQTKLAEKIIAQGAEAKIILKDDKIIKNRFEKKYRISQIDMLLRKSRTRREAKILEKLKKINISCPDIFSVDDKEMKISMQYVNGKKLADVFQESPDKFSEQIGEIVGKMHANDIIHADLTTSNIILLNKKLYFIDFGLSFFSSKEEDKAVDIHLLDRALESRHFDFYPSCRKSFIKGYKKTNPNFKKVLERLEKVESRGRNKKKSL